MSNVWSAPSAEPLAWFGEAPTDVSSAVTAPDPDLAERLHIRGLDLAFCREHYAHYRTQQKKRVVGQGVLF